MPRPQNYERSVFINCPFDRHYRKKMLAITFTVSNCGFIPRCAFEQPDGSQERFARLVKLMASCKFGIHDISRTSLDPANRLPRFNMPFELGLFLGLNECDKGKVSLVLDKERYRYQMFLSDISGRDPAAHQGQAKLASKLVRDWLRQYTDEMVPTATKLWHAFEQWSKKVLPKQCAQSNLDVGELTFSEYVMLAEAYLKVYKPPVR